MSCHPILHHINQHPQAYLEEPDLFYQYDLLQDAVACHYVHFRSTPVNHRLCTSEPSSGWCVRDRQIFQLQQDKSFPLQPAIQHEDDDRIVPGQIGESRPEEQISRFHCQFVLS